MSAATKRKHVVKEMLEDFSMPEHHQTIVKVLGNSGCNLHQVQTPAGDTFLASLPTKFRKNLWIKRGDYVVTEPIDEGNKVKGEVVRILYPQHIKEIKQNKLWPCEFEKKPEAKGDSPDECVESEGEGKPPSSGYSSDVTKQDDDDVMTSSDDDDMGDIPRNTNHPPPTYDSCDDDETSDDDSVVSN